VEYLPGDPHTPGRSYGSHRARRGRTSLSARLTMAAGLGVVLVGTAIAVATGAVQTPLSDSTTAPEAATLAPDLDMSAPSANGNGYALATVPASLLPRATASATKKATPTTHPSATPSSTPSTAKSSSAASDLLTPQPTAEYETPSGENQKAWSEAILTAIGAPLTSANIVSIGYWMQNEAGSPPYGIVGANNPINVSEPGYGGTPIQSDGDGVTYLMSYPSVSEGVAAIAAYLERGNYTEILADLRAGAGLSDPNLASEISLYSGGGYSTIPDSFGASQGTPLS
jgi:hypothetical protein